MKERFSNLAIIGIAIIFISVIGIILFAAFYKPSSKNSAISQDYANIEQFMEYSPETVAGFFAVPGHENLVYSEETQTVYHLSIIRIGSSSCTIMAPYIVNGHYCEFKNNQLVEIMP